MSSNYRILAVASDEIQTQLRLFFRLLARTVKIEFISSGNITVEELSDSDLLLLVDPQRNFTSQEFTQIIEFLSNSGRLWCILSEDSAKKSNVNFLLEQYSIIVNSDTVIQRAHIEYLHPKESTISLKKSKLSTDLNSFAFAYGSTLTVQEPAFSIVNTDIACYPSERPVFACNTQVGKGVVLVTGSTAMFSSKLFDKEKNRDLASSLFAALVLPDEEMKQWFNDLKVPFKDYFHTPTSSLYAAEPLPKFTNVSKLPDVKLNRLNHIMDQKLFKFDLSLVPESLKLFKNLNLEVENLTLIPPQFEMKLPKLSPAVFPPQLAGLKGPPLDLFDLDEEWSTPDIRLAQLCNKCKDKDDDIGFFVGEAANITGINSELPQDQRSIKDILYHVGKTVFQYKCFDQDNFAAFMRNAEGGV
ncbi:hypothetical protein PCE1_004428 [Barthelona sp. PCE]